MRNIIAVERHHVAEDICAGPCVCSDNEINSKGSIKVEKESTERQAAPLSDFPLLKVYTACRSKTQKKKCGFSMNSKTSNKSSQMILLNKSFQFEEKTLDSF